MIDIKCPKCGSYEFDCYDVSFNADCNTSWNRCYCEECGTNFSIKYVAVEVELDDED